MELAGNIYYFLIRNSNRIRSVPKLIVAKLLQDYTHFWFMCRFAEMRLTAGIGIRLYCKVSVCNLKCINEFKPF